MNCAEALDRAPELALGILGGADRAEVILHVNGCARCQACVDEFTEAADALPLLAPEVEPSPGFEDRVLARIGEPTRRHRRRWISAIAVAAAAAAIVSITLVRVVESVDDTRTAAPAASSDPVVAQMIGGTSGLRAGWVSVADHRSVTVAVDYGIPAGTYQVQLASERGSTVALGEMSIDVSGRGFWAGHSDVPIGAAATISLVDAAGEVTCHGTLANRQ